MILWNFYQLSQFSIKFKNFSSFNKSCGLCVEILIADLKKLVELDLRFTLIKTIDECSVLYNSIVKSSLGLLQFDKQLVTMSKTFSCKVCIEIGGIIPVNMKYESKL